MVGAPALACVHARINFLVHEDRAMEFALLGVELINGNIVIEERFR